MRAATIGLAFVLLVMCFADDKKTDADRLSDAVKSYQSYVRKSKRTPRLPVPPLYFWMAKKGDIGLPGGNGTKEDWNKFHVVQVIDEKNMLIENRVYEVVTESGEYFNSKQVLVWVSGYPTNGITDDSYVNLTQIFEVVGTRQYITAAGTRTVTEIKPFSIQNLSELKKDKKTKNPK